MKYAVTTKRRKEKAIVRKQMIQNYINARPMTVTVNMISGDPLNFTFNKALEWTWKTLETRVQDTDPKFAGKTIEFITDDGKKVVNKISKMPKNDIICNAIVQDESVESEMAEDEPTNDKSEELRSTTDSVTSTISNCYSSS